MFQAEIPQAAQLYSVLEGRNPGTIIVDRQDRTRWCVVRPAVGANTFVGGSISANDLHEAVTALQAEDWVCIALGTNAAARSPLPMVHDVVPCLEFRDRSPAHSPQVARAQGSRPEIMPVDERLFSHCHWREFNSKACGGPAAFLNSGIGYCAVIAGGVVSEAYAAFIGCGLTDIGAYTAPDYRQHGYGHLTCSVLLADCEARGIETRWACTATNMGSRALARSLGYRTQIPFQLARYKSHKEAIDPT
jgi:hypothetical protein